MKALFLCALISTALFGADIEGQRTGSVRVVPVESTPEPDEVQVHIAFPANGEVKESNPVTVQIRLEGFPLGVYSDFPRARELRDRKEGQSLHIIVDDQPFIEINEAIDDTADTEELDFDQTIEAKIPFHLKNGPHILRIFPVRSFDESLKGDKAFEAIYFYVGKKEGKIPDLSQPYLTYNQPLGDFRSDKPILLDFFLSNTQLSRDGYKVRLTIDGSDKRILTQWVPYYIYGLGKGSHTIKLELLNPSNQTIPGLFGDSQRTIRVR